MKLLKKITVVIFFFFISVNTVYSNEKVAYLDMEYILKNSNIGKLVLKKINALNEKNIETLKLKDEELKKKEENIKKKQNILSKEELDKEINELRTNINKLRIEKDNMVKNINEFRKQELSKLYKEINPIIQNYMESNNINILLDVKNIIIGKSDYNITDDIIKEVNTKLK